jgi:hypothetical protein
MVTPTVSSALVMYTDPRDPTVTLSTDNVCAWRTLVDVSAISAWRTPSISPTVKNVAAIPVVLSQLFLESALLSPLVNASAKTTTWARTVTCANHFITIWTEDVLIATASHRVHWTVLLNAIQMMVNVSANPTLAHNDAHNVETDSSLLKNATTLDVHLANVTLVVPNHNSVTRTLANVNAVTMLLEENVTDLLTVTTSPLCTIKSTKWKMESPRTTLLYDSDSMRPNSLDTA